ncbi:MAG: DNA polymerase V [Planctomycetota bacterium]|jgi:DNA polymerase V
MTDINLAKIKISDFYTLHKRMPSLREIGTLVGLRSKQSSTRLADKLIEEGFVERDNKGRLLPKKIRGMVRLLGSVTAGFPTATEEDEYDTMTIDEWLITNHESSYMLEVSGDSMVDAGIVDGDYVIAERTTAYQPGDIVIAEIDGKWTMKYLRTAKGAFYLEAANKNYPNLHPKDDLNVAAIVRGVVRKY